MFFDGEFRHIGSVDVKPIAEVVDSLGEDAWNEFVRRQEKFPPHRDTFTIPLLYDNDMRHSDPTPWPRYEKFEKALEPVMAAIAKAHSDVPNAENGYFVRIILTRLRAGGEITIHKDFGPSMMRSHRNHLAVTTNDKVEFWIDRRTQHIAPGEIYEINNRKNHAVKNDGDEDRIHMILDYVIPGEAIDDPDGPLIA